jgi:predicted PurR-regulated permease PerM
MVVHFTTPIRFLTRLGVSRGLATVISLISIAALFVILILVISPALIGQFATLAIIVQDGIQELVDSWVEFDLQSTKSFLGWDGAVPIPQPENSLTEAFDLFRDSFQLDAELVNQVASQLFGALSQLSVSVIPVVSGVAATLLNVLIVIFLSLYFLADPRRHEEGVIRLFPISYRSRVREIIDRLDMTLRGWMESTVLAMIFVGVMTWIALTLLGLREAAALGVIAGVLSFVPNFGTLIALVLAVAVGILQQPQNVGWIIFITFLISLVQSQIISPLLVADRIDLPPVIVLLSQIIAGVFFGFLGILLAVPLAAILMVLIQEVYIKDVLGDQTVGQHRHLRVARQQPMPVEDGLMTDTT